MINRPSNLRCRIVPLKPVLFGSGLSPALVCQMSNATLHQGGGLDGQVVLIVQRSWVVATALANSFEEKGASAVLAKVPVPDLAGIPNLCAAVVDGQSRELCRLLEARGIPFVLYT